MRGQRLASSVQRANHPVLSRVPVRRNYPDQGFAGIGVTGLGNVRGQLDNGVKYEVIETSSDPWQQVAQTIPILRSYIKDDAETLRNQGFGEVLRARYPNLSNEEIAFREAKRRLRFATDQDTALRAFGPEGLSGSAPWVPVEVLQRPLDVIAQSDQGGGAQVAGDCDDYTMTVLCICLVLDPTADVQMVCVPADQATPGILTHIYGQSNGIPIDASHGDYVGWQVPNKALTGPREYFPVNGFSLRPIELLAAAYFALNAYNVMKQLRWIN